MQQPDVAGDHEKALAVVNGIKQQTIDEYAGKVAEGTEKWPGAVSTAAAAGDPAEGPKDWKDASRRANAFLKGRAGQTTS
jgi:ribosomal protein L12E/L44/L45/RPP1/RPP2